MGFKLSSIPATFSGCLTNFRFYRELIGRPLREAFIYLAIMAALPVLLLSGSQIYGMNQLMVEFTGALKGNLPALIIKKGQVEMKGRDKFHFEKENAYPVLDLKDPIDRLNQWSSRSVQPRDDKKELTLKEKERAAALSAERRRSEAALAWIDEHFPGPETVITSGQVDMLLEKYPPADADTAQLLRDTAHSRNFVFMVDLTTEDPQLPPGFLVFGLTKNSLITNIPLAPKIEFSEDTSTVINDDMLDSWRKSIIWQMTPILIGAGFLLAYLIILVFTLGGSAVAGLTASLLKHPLRFRQVFAIGVYAITPAILFILLSLLLALLKINLSYSLWIFLLLYGVYLVSATKKCCSTD